MLIAPAVSMVPAKEPAEPAAVEVRSLKLPMSPTLAAVVGTASPAVYEAENENAFPLVA